MPGVNNFLSLYSIILKLGTKKELVILLNPTLLFLRFWHFWRENDVTKLAPNFGFANMSYLMLLFERTFHKDLKTEKKLRYVNPIKRSNVLVQGS